MLRASRRRRLNAAADAALRRLGGGSVSAAHQRHLDDIAEQRLWAERNAIAGEEQRARFEAEQEAGYQATMALLREIEQRAAERRLREAIEE